MGLTLLFDAHIENIVRVTVLCHQAHAQYPAPDI